jgi:hypothetical protein
MRRKVVVALVGLLAVGSALVLGASASSSSDRGRTAKAAADRDDVPSMQVRDLLEAGPELRPSKAALALSGKRVRLVGYMADMELPPRGALYLVPQPVRCDEAGGGTADLPLESVLVQVASAPQRSFSHVPGPLEAVGTLYVGNETDEQGNGSNFRLKLDAPPAALKAGAGLKRP